MSLRKDSTIFVTGHHGMAGSALVRKPQSGGFEMAYAYLLIPKGASEKVRLTKAFLARKMLEFEMLRSEIESPLVEVAADKQSPRSNRRLG